MEEVQRMEGLERVGVERMEEQEGVKEVVEEVKEIRLFHNAPLSAALSRRKL